MHVIDWFQSLPGGSHRFLLSISHGIFSRNTIMCFHTCRPDWSKIKHFKAISVGTVLLVQRPIGQHESYPQALQSGGIAEEQWRIRCDGVFYRREEITNSAKDSKTGGTFLTSSS